MRLKILCLIRNLILLVVAGVSVRLLFQGFNVCINETPSDEVDYDDLFLKRDKDTDPGFNSTLPTRFEDTPIQLKDKTTDEKPLLKFRKSCHVSELSEKASLHSGGRTKLHHLAFGIGSSKRSWERRAQFVRTWWKENVRGSVWTDELPEITHNNDPQVSVSSNTGHLSYKGVGGVRDFLRIARISKDMFDLRLEGVRWFVIGDDDTFFNPRGIAALLSKYDHNEMIYIGGKSESHWQNHILSQEMAFGGGGYAVTVPLAAALANSIDECLERYPELWGSDQRVAICVAELGVKVVREQGFHQCDIHLSVSGLLESHPPQVFASIHHLEMLQPIFPAIEDKITSLERFSSFAAADPVGFLQQSICHDNVSGNWTLSISWGYSVKFYRKRIKLWNLIEIERTFPTFTGHWGKGDYDLDTRDITPMVGQNDSCRLPFVMYASSVSSSENFIESTYSRDVGSIDCPSAVGNLHTLKVRKKKPMEIPVSKNGKLAGLNLKRMCCEEINFQTGEKGSGKLNLEDCTLEDIITPQI